MQAWKYQPWVQKAVDKRLSKLADVAQPTIGFHVRGGDKLAEDKMLVGSTSAHCSAMVLVCSLKCCAPDILGQKHTTSSCRADAWHAEYRLRLDCLSLRQICAACSRKLN